MDELVEIATALGVPTGDWEGSPSLKVRILAAIEQLSAERDAARSGEAQAALDIERFKVERWRFATEVNSRLAEMNGILTEAAAERDEASRWAVAGMVRAERTDRYVRHLHAELSRFGPPDVEG